MSDDLMTATLAARMRGDFLQLMARPVQLADLGERARQTAPSAPSDAPAAGASDAGSDAPMLTATRPATRPARRRKVRFSADESGQQGSWTL